MSVTVQIPADSMPTSEEPDDAKISGWSPDHTVLHEVVTIHASRGLVQINSQEFAYSFTNAGLDGLLLYLIERCNIFHGIDSSLDQLQIRVA